MKRFYLLCFSFLSIVCRGQADTIFFKNGKIKPVLITVINDTEVKTHMAPDTTGPLIVFKRKEIDRIFYHGAYQHFNEIKPKPATKSEPNGEGKFVISINLAQLLIKHIQGNLERINKKRTFGLNIYYNEGFSPLDSPLTYTRKETTMNEGFYKSSYFGLDFKFYPRVETQRIRYFYAFGAETGETYYRTKNQQGLYLSHVNPFWSLHHKQGCLWMISNRLYLGGEGTLGFNQFFEKGKNSEGKQLRSNAAKFGLGLHLGLAF